MVEVSQTISHYRILDKLGAGGMGIVYRAEDTNLNRQVAIKVLPETFSGDPERMARFEREAKLLASLNHPNIAAIYGFEQADGKRLLVLELVEGETLAQRITRGQLPVGEALEICRQIAEGLESAHEHGVIHRDLKPGNVKLTPEGTVKILDFGLAKALLDDPSAPDISHSPTLTADMTQPGIILGTAAYMAPEQAKGRDVDKRADIWAFGCILYECLTGRRAFEGDTVTEILASVLKSEPDWKELPSTLPWRATDLLHRCLRKSTKDRLHDIADARLDILDCTNQSPVSPAVSRKSRWFLMAASGVAILTAGILIGRAVLKSSMITAAPRLIRSTIKVEPGLRIAFDPEFFRPWCNSLVMSSDGKFLVYLAIPENAGPDDTSRIFLRRLDQTDAKPIPGTEGCHDPFLSPDDLWIGCVASSGKAWNLVKVPITGGTPSPICSVDYTLTGAMWGTNGKIVLAPNYGGGLSVVDIESGKIEPLTKRNLVKGEFSHRLPSWLPDGKTVLFTVMANWADPEPKVAILDEGKGEPRVLIENAADARYVPTGHLVFVRQGKLMAVKFDLAKRATVGQQIVVLPDVMQSLNWSIYNYNTAAGQFAFSGSGHLAFLRGGVRPEHPTKLVWLSQQGAITDIASFPYTFYAPRLSRDDDKVAYVSQGLEKNVWVYDLIRGSAPVRMTTEGIADYVIWSNDSKELTFSWAKTGNFNIFRMPSDGSSSPARLVPSERSQYPGSWSPDGKTLAFVQSNPGTGYDIMLYHADSGEVTPFVNTRFSEQYPEFSPDGKWMAYTSNQSNGRDEVYVRRYPSSGGEGGAIPISVTGGVAPIWSRDQRHLYYLRPSQFWVVDIKPGADISPGKPQLLFEKPEFSNSANPIRSWDISRVGDRFIKTIAGETKRESVTEIMFVENWFEELKRLVPTEKK